MIRTVEYRGHVWTIREVDGQFGFEVAGLPAVWIDAPDALEQMTDAELVELVRSEAEPRREPGTDIDYRLG